jgi:hypothetical protein
MILGQRLRLHSVYISHDIRFSFLAVHIQCIFIGDILLYIDRKMISDGKNSLKVCTSTYISNSQ